MAATKNYYIQEMTTEAMCGDLFDHIDDLLDFPGDEFLAMQGGAMETPYNPGGGFILPTTPAPPQNADKCERLPVGGDAANNSNTINNAADTTEFECGGGKMLFEELDIADLEWVSNFMDDSANSFTAFSYLPKSSSNNSANETESIFRTPSPVSVLLPNSHAGSTTSSSSSSSGGENNGRAILPNTVPARARTKRRRPAAFSSRPQVITIHPFLDDNESFGQLAQKKAKFGTPTAMTTTSGEAATIRKCTHCEIQKTPQWRAGPMGPKTLCNACGVRYKSGRLFPEYRPAASPTFVPALHSNSHKRVVEMRINGGDGQASGCDLLEYIRRKE